MSNKVMKENRYSLLVQLFFYHALYEWRYMPSTKLSDHLPENLMKQYKEQNLNFLDHLKRITMRSLITQYFVYLYEIVNDNFDESLKKSKNDFTKLKFNIDVNGNLKTINSKKLFDIIRQSFAHNDDGNLIPHWMWDEHDNVIIHRKLKSQEIVLKIHISELVSLGNIYLNNAVNPPSLAISMYASRLSKAVLEKKINPFNVHKYVNAFDPNAKVDIPMDKYQKRALYNCITKISEGLDEKTIKMGIHPYDPSYFILKYPFKCNANNAIKDCQKTIQLLSLLKDKFITRNGFMRRVFDSKIEKEEPVDIIEIQDYLGNPGRFEACVANNILFSIFTYMDPSSVKEYLNNDDIDLNRVRNSIMHGRFYYNYESGFDFYDGIIETNTKGKSIKEIEKNIDYIGTLSLKDINILTMNLLRDYMIKYDPTNSRK